MTSDRTMTDLCSLDEKPNENFPSGPSTICGWCQIDLFSTDIGSFSLKQQKNCVAKGLHLARNFLASSLHRMINLYGICTEISTYIPLSIYISISEQFKDKT